VIYGVEQRRYLFQRVWLLRSLLRVVLVELRMGFAERILVRRAILPGEVLAQERVTVEGSFRVFVLD